MKDTSRQIARKILRADKGGESWEWPQYCSELIMAGNKKVCIPEGASQNCLYYYTEVSNTVHRQPTDV